MTNQEIFDKVLFHSRHQKEKSSCCDNDGFEICFYRGTNNLKCFIGALIPDDKYNPLIEGFSCTDYISAYDFEETFILKKILNEIGIDDSQFKFCKYLQLIHDNSNPSNWEKELFDFAKDNGLIFSPYEYII